MGTSCQGLEIVNSTIGLANKPCDIAIFAIKYDLNSTVFNTVVNDHYEHEDTEKKRKCTTSALKWIFAQVRTFTK